ncbi:DUF1036 domain-containing protein [Roseibium sp. SCP14]|uniref:DUF1036 domain-containing protein n=1 Tax=Roseibium sp. SCP14 TaxID=3141375 RepID=UPI0033383E04
MEQARLLNAKVKPKRQTHWTSIAGFMVFAFSLISPTLAHAGLRVCNGSVDLVNIAIGYETEDGLRTEGWWTITSNACSQILQEPLKNTRYYLHVADGFGESRLAGDITLCIREEKFVLYDGDQCWQRGLIEADFFQIETDGAEDWTVLLSYD